MIPDQPYDIDAEIATLGSILLNRDAMIAVSPLLTVADFYYAKHGQIYAAMQDCFQRRVPPDTKLVAAELRIRGQLEDIGGLVYLAALVDGVASSYHAEHYAGIVAEHATRRRLITAGGKIAVIGHDTTRPVAEQVADAARLVTEASQTHDSAGMVPLRDVLAGLYDRLSSGEQHGLMTGIVDLDKLIGGLHPGDLCILAGRPGHGKSSLALTIADTVAHRNQAVAYFSFEMSSQELTQRLLAMHCGVSAQAQRRQMVKADELDTLVAAMGNAAGLPLAIDDRRGLTIADLRSRVLKYAMQTNGLALVIVDYLQLMVTRIRGGMNYSQAIGEISRGLKNLAREVNAPVLALAQMNRNIDGRSEKEPSLSDLRESGDLEADADQVVFIVRPELYDSAEERGIAKLYVKKNRHGETGLAEVHFDAERTLVRDVAPAYRNAVGY